jgi:hypothetical protein
MLTLRGVHALCRDGTAVKNWIQIVLINKAFYSEDAVPQKVGEEWLHVACQHLAGSL